MNIPPISPKPVTTISLKIPALVKEEMARERWLREFGISAFADLIGDTAHIALYDNDPILALGSSDLLGAFSGRLLRGSMRRNEFMQLSLLGTLLTQPAAIFVELKNGAIDSDIMYELVNRLTGFGIELQFERLGQQSWVFTWNLENVVRLHFYMRQIDNYLVISNRQFDFQHSDEVIENRLANAGLQINFKQIQAQAATLHLHQMQNQSSAEYKNMGRLLPFLLLGAQSPQQAAEQYQFFYAEQPPKHSDWVWQAHAQTLQHQQFGTPSSTRLPSYYELSAEQQQTGLFAGIANLQLNFRFVDEGVRIMLELQPE